MSTEGKLSIVAGLRRLYDWVLSFAHKPHGLIALFLFAFAEASFFPIPPDVLLIALALGAPRRAILFAFVCTVGSLAGAVLGYTIGLWFYQTLGKSIIEIYGAQNSYLEIKALYQDWDAIAVAIGGFTPLPYKVFTIAAGAFRIEFSTFMLASAVSRGARFLLIGALVFWFGSEVRQFIDRYFGWLTFLLAVLMVSGFFLLKYAIH